MGSQLDRQEMSAVQVYEFNVPTFGKGVVFDVDHKVTLLARSRIKCFVTCSEAL